MSEPDPDGSAATDADGPDDETVVRAAAEAAGGVILDEYKQSALEDLDVTVGFEDGVLEVDVYLNPPPGTSDADAERVAAAAVEAAETAVDELFGRA